MYNITATIKVDSNNYRFILKPRVAKLVKTNHIEM